MTRNLAHDPGWTELRALDWDWGARHGADGKGRDGTPEQPAESAPEGAPRLVLPDPVADAAPGQDEIEPRVATLSDAPLRIAVSDKAPEGAVPFVFAAPVEDTRPAWKKAWARAKGPIGVAAALAALLLANYLINSGALPL